MPITGPNADCVAQLAEIGNRIEISLARQAGDRLLESTIPELVYLIDRYQAQRSYNCFPEEALAKERRIRQLHDVSVLADFYRLMIVKLLREREERSLSHCIPESVATLTQDAMHRITSGLEKVNASHFSLTNDLFAKDLGISRLKLLPCGAELVEVWSGIPRRVMLTGGIWQLVDCLKYLSATFHLPTKRIQPLYEMHWDRRLAKQFSPAGYNECYLRIADLLIANPEVKGMLSSSWWFDPALETVAPELLFLRKVPETYGARVYRLGPDPQSTRQALVWSAHRRGLYQQGKYVPMRCMLIWARDDLLAWARQVRSSSDAAPA